MDLSNISILSLMPPNFAEDQDVKMMAEAFDKALQEIILKIPNIAIIPNLVLDNIVNEILIDLLAWQFHVDFYNPNLPIETKRELVLKSLDWHYRKGTPSVVKEIVSTVFSRAEIQEWFNYGGLPYRFRIGTDEEMPDAETRANLIRAINSVKNTRSYLDAITTMLFFEDEIYVTDSLTMVVHVNRFQDYYGNRFKFNGAAKFDGVTQNEWIYVNGKFNGAYKFDGELPFGGSRKFNGDYKFNGKMVFNGISPGKIRNTYRLTPPFKFSSWIVDTLSFSIGDLNLEDTQRASLWFDGSVKFDGGSKFNRVSQYPINNPIAGIKNNKFNGHVSFDGDYQFNNVFKDRIKIGHADNALSDVMSSSDEVSMNIYKHRLFNGAYDFNGFIKFDGVPSVTVE
jgi:phage tail P2-like protein